jgi:ribosomal protein L11 methyltransferase
VNDGDPDERWVELLVRVDPRDADLVADVLTTLAPGGVVEEPAIRPRDDADFAYDRLDQPTLLRAFFPSPVAARQRRGLRRRLAALPLSAPLRRLRWRAVTPVDWVEEWRRFYQPIEVGERLLLCPSWLEAPPSDRVVIELDPGEAFGTGQHATTRLCLAALERANVEGARVLDLGCGSGVLAIAAAKLGATGVAACDIDPRAVAVAQRNAEANRTAIAFSVGTLDDVRTDAPFDIVVANISSTVTAGLAAPIARLLSPGGRAILSGFLERDRALVADAARAAGLELRDEATEEGWCVLVGVRL